MAASSAGSTPSASADGSSTPATTPDQPTRGETPQDATTRGETPQEAANRDDTSGRKTSRAKFGLASIVLLTINGIIGSGIFLSPGAVMKVAGTWTPLVYVIAGVFAAVLAVTFAAAARWTSENGAAFAYTRVAFGDDVGFYVGLTRFVGAAIAWGVMATAVVTTVLTVFGGHEAVTTTNITIGFVLLMVVLLAINLAGTGITKVVNNISTIGKVAALVLTIVAGLVVLAMTGDNHFSDLTHLEGPDGSPLVPSMDTTAFVGAMLAAFYAFTGFEGAGSAASEMEDPARNLPRAIPIGVAVVIVVYVAVVPVAMMINPTGVLESKDAVVLASAFDNSIVRDLIVLGALVSMFGINVAASFNTPRIFDAMSRRRMLPAAASRTSQRGVPVVAFVVTAVLAIVVPMAFGYSMRGIMVISSVTRFVQFVMVPLALILCFLGRTRHRPNDVKRSVVLDVVFPILSIAASVFLMVEFDWRGQFSNPGGGLNLWAVAAMIVGYVVLPAALYLPWKLGVYDDTPKQLPEDR